MNRKSIAIGAIITGLIVIGALILVNNRELCLVGDF